jgi:hypothetical protein
MTRTGMLGVPSLIVHGSPSLVTATSALQGQVQHIDARRPAPRHIVPRESLRIPWDRAFMF